MEFKRIIVMANSIKRQARCVAGIEVDIGNDLIAIGWIRPVSGESEGELEPRHMSVAGDLPVNVLDIVDIPLISHANDRIHPEDWIVDSSQQWKRVGQLDTKMVGTLEDQPSDLWLDSRSHSDRATAAFLSKRPRHRSIYLIRPNDFRVEISVEHNKFRDKNQKKTRAKFSYHNQDYEMSITDPLFTDRYCRKYPNAGAAATIVRPKSGDHCLLCVSLTPMFNGYHYKVVATVLELQ
jgi:hypothetical protein